MHDIVKHKYRRWALALAAGFTVSLVSGGGAAAKSVPLPPEKPPFSASEQDNRRQDSKRSDVVPVPQKKPVLAVNAAIDNVEAPKIALPSTAGEAFGPWQEERDNGKVMNRSAIAIARPPVPKAKPMGRPGSPLNNADALLYKKIFAYQSMAAWDRADELMHTLRDFRLRGHVLFQRYMHPTAYKTSFEELEGWMNAYADHPGAEKIYSLAMKRMPENYKGHVRPPVRSRGINGYLDIFSDYNKSYRSPVKRSGAARNRINTLARSIGKDLARGAPTRAYKRLRNEPAGKELDSVEYDELRARIANSYMMAGKPDKALALAMESARRSGDKVPLAGWVGGLVSWQRGQYKQAAPLFESTATSSYASPWTASAGAYWASRAHMRAGNIHEVSRWLRHAAANPRTFYGLIATRALGWDFDFDWSMPEYTAAHEKLLHQFPEAQRAMLLVHAGQYHLAEKELRQITPEAEKGLTEALLAYAHDAGLPSYSMRLASSVKTPEGRLYDAALFPLSPWQPQGGYKVDRALIHALIRQESKFNPMAESRSGATGLMQLMPATATFMSGRRDYRSREGQYNLKEPQLNLNIGQSYVENLLYQGHIGTELFSLMIAYNAGPGNLRKWKNAYHDLQNDPLLFVEMIPMRETRAFVERVMANYWIYRLRMGQPTPSLDAVAEGQWARYVQLDNFQKAVIPQAKPYQVASHSN